MTDFQALLRTLVGQGVRFIIVGGAAATAMGSVPVGQLILHLDRHGLRLRVGQQQERVEERPAGSLGKVPGRGRGRGADRKSVV